MFYSKENSKFDPGVKGLNETLRNKGNDHQLKKLLTVKQILLVSRKCFKCNMENMHTDDRV